MKCAPVCGIGIRYAPVPSVSTDVSRPERGWTAATVMPASAAPVRASVTVPVIHESLLSAKSRAGIPWPSVTITASPLNGADSALQGTAMHGRSFQYSCR